MELHGIQPGAGLKEIRCRDCGHVFLVGADQRSGTCSACGNIEYVVDGVRALSEELVARRILPRLREEKPADPLAEFHKTPDGAVVEELRTKYQVEWQLWAALTRDFRNPALHQAYLTRALAANELDRASSRYRDHSAVMALLDDSRWQAEIADLMVSRIEQLALVRMPNARGNNEFDIPTFFKLLPFDSRIWKVAYVVFGACLMAKFFKLIG